MSEKVYTKAGAEQIRTALVELLTELNVSKSDLYKAADSKKIKVRGRITPNMAQRILYAIDREAFIKTRQAYVSMAPGETKKT